MAVTVISGTRRLPIVLNAVENFRNRAGWAVVATLTDENGKNPREHEMTRQFKQPDDAVEALALFSRAETVEFEGEDDPAEGG